jgi:hypothetical protein
VAVEETMDTLVKKRTPEELQAFVDEALENNSGVELGVGGVEVPRVLISRVLLLSFAK